MTKNNSKKSTADQAAEKSIAILSMESITQELEGYHVPSHELSSKSFFVDLARRNASCDLKEATAKLELAKLRGSQPSAASKQREWDLALELEEIAALRKFGTIFESLARAADELGAIACQAKPHAERLAEMNAKAQRMRDRLENYQTRDVREELKNYENLENELNWTRELLDTGKWRHRGGEARGAMFVEEISLLRNSGRYTGELSMEGAERHITLLEKKLAVTDARLENQLTPEEMNEMPRLSLEIADLDAAIQEETRYSHFVITSSLFQEARFGQLLEAARISAESVVESYQITREMLALQVA